MNSNAPIYLAAAVRTPIGRFGGTLAPLSAADLGTAVAQSCLSRAGISPSEVDETLWGHGRQAGGGPNTARQVSIRSGVPETVPAATLNMACGSGLLAIVNAIRNITLQESQVVLAGGVESMSNTPYLLPRARWGYRMGHAELVDGMYKDGFHCPLADQLMGATAETLAERYSISREEQDHYAVDTQVKAERAWAEGAFDAEVIPVTVPGKKGDVEFTRDEHFRPGTTLADLARLPAVFKKGGSVHAGNSSGVTDGASALLVLSAAAAERLGVTPLARVVSHASAGVDPKVMGLGPVPSTRLALEKAGLTLSDMDLIELNEAFAAQVLACDREMGLPRDRLNVHGGSIALGHPIGATGVRITTTLLHAMKRHGARRGLATLCISGGMGLSLVVEAV